jgi:hypothetical protein
LDVLLQKILIDHGIADPERLVDCLTEAGYELRHSMFLQTVRTLGFGTVEAFWARHYNTSFSELEKLTGHDRKNLHRWKPRSGRPNQFIAAQTEVWGEAPEE